MFEQSNENAILCGVIEENDEYSPIYCDPTTGECYFPDTVMSCNRLISELSVGNPVDVEFSDIVAAMEDGIYGECIGVIYDGEHIIKLIADDSAVRVPVDAPLSGGDGAFSIDIYGDYDEE